MDSTTRSLVRRRPKRSPSARKQPKKSEVTRTRILDAAAHVFYNKGYALTRLSDIAKRARTQTGSIYYYFESREAIVAEVLRIANERTAQHVLGAIAGLPPGATIRDKIVAAVHGHCSIVLSGDPYTAAHMRIFDQIPVRLRDYFLRVLDERAAVWRKLFADAEAAGEIRDGLDLSVVRLLVLGMINWSIEWYKPGGLSPDEIAETAATLLFDGIAKKKAKR
jgi:TetR/AcrR family transcriptional regulator, cholesterol catabolism regulator